MMEYFQRMRMWHQTLLLLVPVLLAGCSVLPEPAPEQVHRYALLYVQDEVLTPAIEPGSPRVLVRMPTARPGCDTPRMAYRRDAYTLDFFASNRWLDEPARMLQPLLMDALRMRTALQAVNHGAADFELHAEWIHLYQDFGVRPSQLRLGLQFVLYDVRDGRELARMRVEESESAPNENARGGAIAANRILASVLPRLADWMQEAVRK